MNTHNTNNIDCLRSTFGHTRHVMPTDEEEIRGSINFSHSRCYRYRETSTDQTPYGNMILGLYRAFYKKN